MRATCRADKWPMARQSKPRELQNFKKELRAQEAQATAPLARHRPDRPPFLPTPSPYQHNSQKRLCSVKHPRHLPRTSSWCQLSRTSLAIIGCAAYRPNHYQLIPRPRACRTFTRFIFKQHRSAQETCWANFLICGEVKRFRSCYRRSSRRFGSLP